MNILFHTKTVEDVNYIVVTDTGKHLSTFSSHSFTKKCSSSWNKYIYKGY